MEMFCILLLIIRAQREGIWDLHLCTEFDKGILVVKGSSRRFNQVDPDQGPEWLDGT